MLFSGSVRHNLLLGRPAATETEIWDALRQAHADEFVRQMPTQLDEPVGERGARLSADNVNVWRLHALSSVNPLFF